MNYPPTLYVKWMQGTDNQADGFWFTCDFPVDGATTYYRKENKMLTINKEKFVNHLTHFLAQETIPFLEKIGKVDDIKKMKSIKVVGGWNGLKEAYTWSDLRDLSALRALSALSALRALSDLRDLSDLSDLRALSALRDLSALRALSDLRDLSALSALRDLRDLRDLRALRAKELVSAYVYAGGKKADLKVEGINSKQLIAIETKKWGFDMSTFEDKTFCGTTYCMAGGAVVLSQQQELKEWLGWANVGAMVYYVSTGHVPDFYSDNETALEYMRNNQ